MKSYFKKILALFAALSISAAVLCTVAAAEGVFTPRRAVPARESKTGIVRTVTPKDFVHTYELKIGAEGAIHRLTLPKFVYEGIIQSETRDIAVFNSKAEIVPFVVRETAQTYTVRRFEYRVPFYELPPGSRSENAIGRLDVYVNTDTNGQVVSVKSTGKNEEAHERRYLLDFSSVTESGDTTIKRELRLTLPDMNLSGKLSVFESANLRDWRPLLENAPLLRLKNMDSSLTSDSVVLPRAPGRYVLLKILDIDRSFELALVRYSVTVRSGSIREEEEAEIDGAPAGKANSAFAVEYDAKGAFPISKVNFVLQEAGFYRIKCLSRPENKGEWRSHGQMELSMIMTPGGKTSSNSPKPVSKREDRFWRIEFDRTFSGALPKMKISWYPSEICFLAQGNAPYVLAVGSPIKGLALQDSSFLKGARAEDDLLPPVESTIDKIQPAGGEIAKPNVELSEDAEWQRYVVWGLMGLSGLLLSAIALKLLRKE